MISERVEKFLDDIGQIDAQRLRLVSALREQVLALAPEAVEEVKYGGLHYSAPVPCCGIFSYAQHVSLEFSHGAELADPHQVLEGSGKFRRHIKLRSAEEIESKQVADYIARALAVAAKMGTT